MGLRLFAAIRPPEDLREELEEFLLVRPELRWVDPSRWHMTLTFMPDVAPWRLDNLEERLAEVLMGVAPFEVSLTGGGAFPNPFEARVLWLGVDDPTKCLERVARKTRNAANAVGANPEGRRFVPHLTLARLNRPADVTRWLQIIGTFRAPAWQVREVELVESHMPRTGTRGVRHEILGVFPLLG